MDKLFLKEKKKQKMLKIDETDWIEGKRKWKVLVGHRNRVENGDGLANDMTGSDDFSQRGVPSGCCRPGRLVDVEGDPLGVTGPLLPRDNQEYRSPSEDSGLGADMPRTRSRRFQ